MYKKFIKYSPVLFVISAILFFIGFPIIGLIYGNHNVPQIYYAIMMWNSGIFMFSFIGFFMKFFDK